MTDGSFRRAATKLGRETRGQTVIEYALVVAVLSLGMMVAINAFGSGLVTSAGSLVDGLLP
jgi:Flp pilus assembly pilin Flp